ncbi:hypothetical protein Tsubulata_045164 [Turnera subulata]|uniref:Uncharacterized protein n=1 Tax=Turnera subulata TaxID=218843 RepID=A0A9Q0JHQ8_9ROSI|nr:hypothetical protein Tsubulata_045164 [Turnera subulata]
MSSCHLCFVYLMMVLVIVAFNLETLPGLSNKLLQSSPGDNKQSTTADMKLEKNSSHRKLFVHGTCRIREISISQSRVTTSGIPQFIVQIVNTCISGCAPSDIHLHCGWFASARMVNPRIFKRLSYDDCLVNAGKPLKSNEIIRFTYSNSFMYTLAFKSAKFC